MWVDTGTTTWHGMGTTMRLGTGTTTWLGTGRLTNNVVQYGNSNIAQYRDSDMSKERLLKEGTQKDWWIKVKFVGHSTKVVIIDRTLSKTKIDTAIKNPPSSAELHCFHPKYIISCL